MAIFSNQATLTYNGNTTNSNIAYGELLEVLTATKTALEADYAPGDLVTYVVSLRNSGATALNGLTFTDDLGGYPFGAGTVYPLSPVDTTLRVFVNGVLQADPAVNAGPPLTITGLNIPAGGDATILYQTRVNNYANPATDGVIRNTVTITGGGITNPVTALAELPASATPTLTIAKSISPAQVADNDRVTYTFLIQNLGAVPVTVADNAAVTDTFDPILTALTVTLDGAAFTQYTYNQNTGLFATTPGALTVPAATYTQDPTTGQYTVTPGTATLSVTGTI